MAETTTWLDGTGASEHALQELERRLGVTLPEDYRKLVLHAAGGVPTDPCIDFAGQREKVVATLLSPEPDHPYSISGGMYALEDRLPPGLVPFAEDPFGSFYCFDTQTAPPFRVVYLDHEEPGREAV